MTRFSNDGKLIIPINERLTKSNQRDEESILYIVDKAYCPKGCCIIENNLLISGFPGLRIGFKRPGVQGEFVISAIEEDFNKEILSGHLEEGVRDELFCPHCGEPFAKLVNCYCKNEGEMVVVGLTPQLDYNNAVTFCNVTGCSNGSFIKSGEVLRHDRLKGFICC
jgi:hypothetical protein